MSNQLERLEAALGGKLEQVGFRAIPGFLKQKDSEVLYFSIPTKTTHRKQFHSITNYTNPPFARFGGVSESGCCIKLPDSTNFYALTYHGDLMGWRKDIEEGAEAAGSLLAKIDEGKLNLFDGRSFDLNECKIIFE